MISEAIVNQTVIPVAILPALNGNFRAKTVMEAFSANCGHID